MSRLKSVVVLQDILGIGFTRANTIRATGQPVVVVSPEPFQYPGQVTFKLNPNWLPTNPTDLKATGWYKADAAALSALTELAIQSDFVWFVESDVWAEVAVWQALFDKYEESKVDCLHLPVRWRRYPDESRHWQQPGVPENAQKSFIMAVYRLSHRAIEAMKVRAEENRGLFSEITIPWVMQQAGMSMKTISARFVGPHSFKVQEHGVVIDRTKLNHPVKGLNNGN